MRIRNIIGVGLAALAMSAGLAAPAQAAPPSDKVFVVDSAGPVQTDAWSDCYALLCLWEHENYNGIFAPVQKSGNIGSYSDKADSVRNKTGYYAMLYVDAYYKGSPCLLIGPLASHPNIGQIDSRFHDSISSVQFFQYESDAIRSCGA